MSTRFYPILGSTVSYSLSSKIIEKPRCHDQEVITLNRHFEPCGLRPDGVTVPIAEINSCVDIKLLREDDICSHVYYSTEEHKIEILKKMKDSMMDRFDTHAPEAGCPEELFCKKVDELIDLTSLLFLDGDE